MVKVWYNIFQRMSREWLRMGCKTLDFTKPTNPCGHHELLSMSSGLHMGAWSLHDQLCAMLY